MLTVDLDSPVPLEEQIRQGIRLALAREELVVGDELPSVRQLAGDLGIHWNTVARAYRRLRDEGWLTMGRGRRVTVRAAAPPRGGREKTLEKGRIRMKLREVLVEARLSGVSDREVRAILEEEVRTWGEEVKR